MNWDSRVQHWGEGLVFPKRDIMIRYICKKMRFSYVGFM